MRHKIEATMSVPPTTPPSTAMKLGMQYAAMSRRAKMVVFFGLAVLLGGLIGLASAPMSPEQKAAAVVMEQKAAARAAAWNDLTNLYKAEAAARLEQQRKDQVLRGLGIPVDR